MPSPQTTGHFFLNKPTAFYGEVGGAVPTTACAVGQTEPVPYKADYFFFRADKQSIHFP